MDDKRIIDLYWRRSERAITETDIKYGHLCYSIAHNILDSREDSEESVNDTYMAAWNAMPSHRPNNLMAFLAKLARRISVDRWRSNSAQKRGGGQIPLVLEELADCESGAPNAKDWAIERETYYSVEFIEKTVDLLTSMIESKPRKN